MVTRHNFLVLAACAALAFAAVGCGDDSSKTPNNDAGSDSGAKDAGGDPVKMCTADSVAKKAPAACAACVCKNATAESAACAADKDCWNLIGCIATMCAGQDPTTCAIAMCPSFFGGAVAAMPLNTTLTKTCATECVAPAPKDAGMQSGNDAGSDAGN